MPNDITNKDPDKLPQEPDHSRRTFLKNSGFAVGGLIVGGVGGEFNSAQDEGYLSSNACGGIC
ncbi:hypothetical protein JCM16418_887 [Paenibacillus pini JCM 16418]|uniref:Uncharacterized protein n=1 Tax=Paenibacillus pini JCM 16418 TaxID=1236976 RepID=W7YH18_9BACL|nr:hypothetical protein JCM16418_887 [Paenibacillus pini JCM 16418]